MVLASYKNNGHLYTVEPAQSFDIEIDANLAMHNTGNMDLSEYMSRMHDSVDQNLAYHILKDGVQVGMMYNRVTSLGYEGCCIYCVGDVIATMVLLKSMFEVYDTHKILITPFGGSLKYFISMATPDSIREFHLYGTPLTIVRSQLESQGPRLFKYLGIEVL